MIANVEVDLGPHGSRGREIDKGNMLNVTYKGAGIVYASYVSTLIIYTYVVE